MKMSTVNLPLEQPSPSKSSSRDVVSGNTGESVSTLAAVMLNENSSSVAAEEGKDNATATGTSSSYSSPPQPPQHQLQEQQQQASVNISLRDISEILGPFFGTNTALPSSQQQQQQRGRPQNRSNTDVIAAAEAPNSNDNNMDPTQDVNIEEARSAFEDSRGLTSGDEKSGEADGIQGMEEIMEAPGNSWMETIWEMELEKSKMMP